MTRPLRSTPITGASALLRTGPPASAATVLSASRFLPPGALPLATGQKDRQQCQHSPSHVPCESRRPDSRRLHAGHHLASKRVSARLFPGLLGCPGFDAIYLVSTRHQRFAHARLPGPHLTRFPRAFSSSLTTTVFSQRSMRWFDASPRRTTPKGQQSFISRIAPRSITHLPQVTSRVRDTPQFPKVPSTIPSPLATCAIGRDVSITSFTASSRNSGE
jgi:hypothetical protein